MTKEALWTELPFKFVEVNDKRGSANISVIGICGGQLTFKYSDY